MIVGAYTNDQGGSNAGRAHGYDLNRYHVLAPNGGETWNVGALKSVSWLGAVPADVWLSADGGNTFQLQLSGVGGSAQNAVVLRVPHLPPKFARVQLTPHDPDADGQDRSDSLFTIQTSVALLSMLAAPLPGGGVSITWQTDPGADDLAGYRLDRAVPGSTGWVTIVPLTPETSYTDKGGGAGARYRLYAVNGFGEELWLGEASIPRLVPLAAWPLPYRGGDLTISFAAAGGLGGGRARTEVAIFDLRGRLVRRVVDGTYAQGFHTAAWDGRDGLGRPVASGVYFLRARNLGQEHTIRLSVLR